MFVATLNCFFALLVYLVSYRHWEIWTWILLIGYLIIAVPSPHWMHLCQVRFYGPASAYTHQSKAWFCPVTAETDNYVWADECGFFESNTSLAWSGQSQIRFSVLGPAVLRPQPVFRKIDSKEDLDIFFSWVPEEESVDLKARSRAINQGLEHIAS